MFAMGEKDGLIECSLILKNKYTILYFPRSELLSLSEFMIRYHDKREKALRDAQEKRHIAEVKARLERQQLKQAKT